MIHRRLEEEVERVAIRLRRLHAWTALATVWFATALVGAVALALAWRADWVPAWVVLALTGAGALAAFVVVMFTAGSARNVRSVARRIEAQHPDLDSVLLVAVEQQPDLPGGQFSFLKASVVHEALAHCQRRDWGSAVSEGRIRTARFASAAAVFLLATTIGGLWSISARGMPEGSLRFDDDVVLSIQQSDVEVLPGDTAIERGTSLIVTARFGGDPPDDATLVYRDASGAAERVPMSLSLSDPIFGARVANVQSELAYHVEYARSKTRIYRATVFVYPQLMRADAILTFPEYTTLSVKHIEDVRRITAVEGTEITLVCHLNKPVASATLVDEDGNVTELVADAEVPTTYSVSQTPKESGRYKLHLLDAQGRKNQDPAEFVFNVTPNQRPDVKMAMPAGDTRVSPIEELATKANVWDDYGLKAYGISYSFGDDESREIDLGEVTGRNERRDVAHLVDFESLDAEPDQLLAYHFWAEDIGPDGELRRTMGDLYFAEVRHFEEIFREGQPSPGGAGSQGPQSPKLIELQKQIVGATWTVIRRETPGRPTEDFIPDSRDLQGSQQLAVDQAQELAKEIEDAEAAEYLAVAEGHMKDAVVELTKVVESTSVDALGPALAAERSAYQALLKLLAREFEVTRGSPGRAAGRQNRSQRQLDQLELSDADNRYETQRQSSQRQDQATDENREMLIRLRDLARRQADLNQRLREMQSALE